MKSIIRYIYTTFYSHVIGETKKDLVETSNQQLCYYIVLSPITIVFALIGIKLKITNIVIVLPCMLIYVFGLNYILNKLITLEVAEKYLIIQQKVEKNYIKYYLLTFTLLVFTILLSALTLFIGLKNS